ncbi:MAG: hypothetical protein V3U30_03655 [Thermoplasmata archaeon]
MTTELENDGLTVSDLVNGIILGALFVKGKRAALKLYSEEFLGLSQERLDSLLLESMARMLNASQEWASRREAP